MSIIDSFEFLERELIRGLYCMNDCLAIYGALHLFRNLIKVRWLFKAVYQFTKRKIDLKNFGSYAVISSIEQPLGKEIALNLAEKHMNLILLVGDQPDKECSEFLKQLAGKGVEVLTINPTQLNRYWSQVSNKTGEKGKGAGQASGELTEQESGQLTEQESGEPTNQESGEPTNQESDEQADLPDYFEAEDELSRESSKESVKSKENLQLNKPDKSSEVADVLQIMAKDIGILINCSDYQPDRLKRWLSYDGREIDSLIETNIIQPMKLQRLFLEKLIQREHAMVLQVSSLAAVRPVPYLSLYSASKRFTDHLARSLACESRKKNRLFKTWIVTRSTSHLFDAPRSSSEKKLIEKIIETKEKAKEITGQTKSGRLLKRLFIALLPDKQKLISSVLLQNASYETTGHWLFALEYYLADCLPQFSVNLLLEYMLPNE